MKKEKAYCQCCDKDVDYITKVINDTATIRGVYFTYPYIQARCKKCGEIVFPVSIGKINSIALFDGYKKQVGLLTSQEIIDIRKRLGLTQEQLAKKMGCGLKTITRYENGAIQDRVFDNFLRVIDKYEIIDNKEKVVSQKQLIKKAS